jgi:hypothetical protein
MDDDPSLNPAQQKILREVSTRLMGALTELAVLREKAYSVDSTPDQLRRHTQEFNRCVPDNLISQSFRAADKAGIDLRILGEAFSGFREAYPSSSACDGTRPMTLGMISHAGSMLQSLLYPLMPLQADMILHRVEKGLKTLSDLDKAGWGLFGTRLAWSVLLTQPGILNEANPNQELLSPSLVHRLAMVPLHHCVGQVTRPKDLRQLEKNLAKLPPGYAPHGPWPEDLLVFSQIYWEPIHTQPFYEGNHRTGWILANQWLLRNCGAYIPWDQTLEDQVREIRSFEGRKFPLPFNLNEIIRHKQRAKELASSLENKVQLVSDV